MEVLEPESFEELVEELMQRQDRVETVESTSRGGDLSAASGGGGSVLSEEI